jgi:hypothetical protein
MSERGKAMTNEQIVLKKRIELMNAGIIKGTGRQFTIELADGETKTVDEPEFIHTFAVWKSLGYVVKKGEHAIAVIDIWKQGKPRTAKDEKTGEETEKAGRMFMKTAYFFKFDQVEPLKEKTA